MTGSRYDNCHNNNTGGSHPLLAPKIVKVQFGDGLASHNDEIKDLHCKPNNALCTQIFILCSMKFMGR